MMSYDPLNVQNNNYEKNRTDSMEHHRVQRRINSERNVTVGLDLSEFKIFSYYQENGRQFVDLTNPNFMA